jgi:hypothetical protein
VVQFSNWDFCNGLSAGVPAASHSPNMRELLDRMVKRAAVSSEWNRLFEAAL